MILGFLNRKRIKRLEERVDNVNEFNRATLTDLKTIRDRLVEIEEFYATDFNKLEERLKKNVSDEIKLYLSEANRDISNKIENLSKLVQNKPIF
jgi:ribosomal protein L9